MGDPVLYKFPEAEVDFCNELLETIIRLEVFKTGKKLKVKDVSLWSWRYFQIQRPLKINSPSFLK